MKLLVVSPAALRTPPADNFYGGIEKESAYLVRGLTELGHGVDLVARSDSMVPENGTLYGIKDEREIADTVKMIEGSGVRYDAIIDFTHDHLLSLRRPDLPLINTSSVMSMTGSGISPVCISYGQANGPNFRDHEVEVIHYGLDLDEYPLYTGPRDDYLLYLGQIIPGKRIEWACEVALATGKPLRIHGPGWGDAWYHDKLREYVARGNGLITWGGEIGGREKIETLQKAFALIHPVGGMDTGGGQWVEAGAICVLESLAVGTPVIVSDNGCLPEYILGNPLVGSVCSSVGGMCLAVESIRMGFSSNNCRKRSENFTYLRMARKYSILAEKVASGFRWNEKNAIGVVSP